jgi:hypothetical protein
MSSPSSLGDIGFQIAMAPATTATGEYYSRTSDTGTVLTTGLAILDLARHSSLSVTGGKPLDSRVHPRQLRQFRSVGVVVPWEAVFHTSGVNLYVRVQHRHRAAAAGAGSTWEILKTDTLRYKAGTDTDVTYKGTSISSCNAMAIKRFYRAHVSFLYRKASDTAVKDTSTNIEMYVKPNPLYLLGGADAMPAQ